MTTQLVVVGAGGFGRETLDVAAAVNAAAPEPVFELIGVLDDAPSEANLKRLAARGAPYAGPIDAWPANRSDVEFVIGIGSPAVRRALAERLERAGHRAAVLVHPHSVIGSMTTIGPGSVICGGAQISTNVQLGRHVHVNPNATIGHDTVLDDFVSINPAATISGECRIGREALIGAAATVLQRLTVSRQAVVGAAACVVHDVHSGTTVRGVPARASR